MAKTLFFASLGAALALPFVRFVAAAKTNSTIEWSSCSDWNKAFGNYSDSFQCGYFDVPLDWADESVGTAHIAVVKYPAADKEKKGTVFFNPGGPGASGVEFLITHAEEALIPFVGTGYDLVGWDPRGTTYSTPGVISCFKTKEEYAAVYNGSLITDFSVDPTNALLHPKDVKAFYDRMDETDKRFKQYGDLCTENAGDVLKYVGTVATVRDMVAIADYLEPDSKEINYYGASYGTIIGATFVNMFPDRVGRVVIDGVVDPQLYAGAPGYETMTASVESRDAALAGFAKECAKAGKRCALRLKETDTGDDILDRVYRLVKNLYKLYEAGQTPEGILTPSAVTRFIQEALYKPKTWGDLAAQLKAIYDIAQGNDTSTSRRFVKRDDNDDDQQPADISDSLMAISCGDSVDAGNATIQNTFDEILFVTRNVSPLFGPSFSSQGTSCYAWPVRAVERYAGPWNNKLSNPILVIGNQADPVTPFKNAKQIADQLGDSAVLIEQSGYGHASIAEFSKCTTEILKDYYGSGKTPSNDSTYCFVEEDNKVLFPANSTGNDTSSSEGSPVSDTSIDADAEGVDLDDTVLSAVSDAGSEDGESIDELKKAKQTFRIMTIVFGSLSAVLGSALCWSIIRNYREQRKYSRVQATDALEPAWAAHQPTFANPYDSAVNQPQGKAAREL
ncbi:alpha/beta-hydrolase [Schizophyllum commune H4-8]|nr:alpha/beta-hydrolase [Schizophyllum commune H4-8]KAI5894742.1 alpha/beta-hydrolase [Schizophyllum commune H4-8]